MANNAITEILELCLSIDQKTSDVYQNFCKQSKEENLKLFWQDMINAEENHILYWEDTINLVKDEGLYNVFEKPNEVIAELTKINERSNDIVKQSNNVSDISTFFILAYRLEFYLLHPAFETLFYFVEKDLKNKLPGDSYKEHINKFVLFINMFGISNPEFELTADVIKWMWRNNRRLAKRLYDIKTLEGLIPICASCKKIRDDNGFWGQVESYIKERADVDFTHSVCPECIKELYPEVCIAGT